ncbi:MAG: N-acetylmuramoyl-L-alanine amidase [Actinoallomurus sp.]|nr:N-acetylmuramoyl-L-alanine amidase [Actinoallomurus sp.]
MTHSGRRAFGALAAAAVAGLLGGCGSGGSSSASAAPPSPAPASASTTPSSSPQGSLAGKVIVLDPGHNGGNAKHPEIINKRVYVLTGYKPCNTTGTATDDGYPEHAFNWDVANRLAKILRAKGAKVVLTRNSDNGVGPCVDERARIANRAHANATLSIHADGAPPKDHGFHVIEPAVINNYNDKVVPVSRRLGLDIRDAFHQGTGIPYADYVGKNGLNIRSDLGGLNLAKVPAVFIECGNMRNPGDAAKMKSPQGRQQMADALSQGFVTFLS